MDFKLAFSTINVFIETELLTTNKTGTNMTDKEVERENIKKRAIVEQAFNDCYINDIKRCFSILRVCAVYFTDISTPKLIELRKKHNVDIDDENCFISCVAYDMGKDNKERIFVYYTPTKRETLKHRTFEVGKPTEYLDLLESSVELLKEFSKNYLPRIIYDYVGDDGE